MNEEILKDAFRTWGTYRSFSKDILIIHYFVSHDWQKNEHRQKEIINHFRREMAPVTTRKHLYKLCKMDILEETSFRGTYELKMKQLYGIEPTWDRIIEALMGKDVYNAVLEIWKQRYTDSMYNKWKERYRNENEEEQERESQERRYAKEARF